MFFQRKSKQQTTAVAITEQTETELTAMQVLARIESLCSDRPQAGAGDRFREHDPVINEILLPRELSRAVAKLVDDETGERTRALLVHEDPRATSLTHMLAARFPNLPVRDLWVTTGGPELNHNFCRWVMADLLAHFNRWAISSGFRNAVSTALQKKQNKLTREFGGVTLKFRHRCMFGGMAVDLTRGRDTVCFAFRNDEYGFYREIYNTSLGEAVEIVETFMQCFDKHEHEKAAHAIRSATTDPAQLAGEAEQLIQELKQKLVRTSFVSRDGCLLATMQLDKVLPEEVINYAITSTQRPGITVTHAYSDGLDSFDRLEVRITHERMAHSIWT